jgi:hypothetical protein
MKKNATVATRVRRLKPPRPGVLLLFLWAIARECTEQLLSSMQIFLGRITLTKCGLEATLQIICGRHLLHRRQ